MTPDPQVFSGLGFSIGSMGIVKILALLSDEEDGPSQELVPGLLIHNTIP